MRRKRKPLPKTIYAAHKPERTDGTGPTFLCVAEAAADLAEIREIVEVGKYELVERAAVSGFPTVLPARSRVRGRSA